MDNNAKFPEDLQLQIEEILLKVDELNNADAVLYCSNEINKKVKQNNDVNDYSSFIPAINEIYLFNRS